MAAQDAEEERELREEVSTVLADPTLRPALTQIRNSSQAEFVDDACVRRYLRACEGNTTQAAAMLAATIHWRLSEPPACKECSACAADPRSHNQRVVGWDLAGRPVIYTCFSQALHRFDPVQNLEHVTRTLEDSCVIMAARNRRTQSAPVETAIWLVDFHGYHMIKDSDPRTALLAARLMAHFPERLHRCVLVDAPGVFSATWSALCTVINANTASKVNFVRSSGGALEAELASWASTPLQHWLHEEIYENRREECQQGKKSYWLPRSHGHDPRAEDEFLRSPEFQLTLTSRLANVTSPKLQSSPSTVTRFSTAMSEEASNASGNSSSSSILSLTVAMSALLSAAHLISFQDRSEWSWSTALLMLAGMLLYLSVASFSSTERCTSSKPEPEPETSFSESRLQPPAKKQVQHQARNRIVWLCLPCS